MVTILQRFDLVLEDPSYELELKQTLTVKPYNFHIHAIPRTGSSHLLAVPSSTLLGSRENTTTETVDKNVIAPGALARNQALYVLYGSNSGSSEAFAHRIAQVAAAHGTSALYCGDNLLRCRP